MTHPTSESRFLKLIIVLLGIFVVLEAGAIWSLKAENQRIAQRISNLSTMGQLGREVDNGILLTLTGEDVGFQVADLLVLRKQARNWVEEFAREHNLTPSIVLMLHAVMEERISAYGRAKVREAIGEIQASDLIILHSASDNTMKVTVGGILQQNRSEAFIAEFDQAWPVWLASMSQ